MTICYLLLQESNAESSYMRFLHYSNCHSAISNHLSIAISMSSGLTVLDNDNICKSLAKCFNHCRNIGRGWTSKACKHHQWLITDRSNVCAACFGVRYLMFMYVQMLFSSVKVAEWPATFLERAPNLVNC